MKHYGNRVDDLVITYIGGGSCGWAWTLVSDLARAKDLSGTVRLYDIDAEAAHVNAVIGNSIPHNFRYEACSDLAAALKGADFVVISILPGTFDEMESDVHTPEKYGIWQSVGDTTGPGGIVRALRTLPMFEVFGRAIRDNCPNAWVINYTNPMTLCVRTLYQVFPGIRAFGCCHEVFGSQDRVKSDTFLRYGAMGAAGDRHLAEFSRGGWYLRSPEIAESWGFTLTPVSYRKADRAERLKLSADYYSGKTPFQFKDEGEEGVDQMRTLLGLGDMMTNVNLPNRGQIPNLPR